MMVSSSAEVRLRCGRMCMRSLPKAAVTRETEATKLKTVNELNMQLTGGNYCFSNRYLSTKCPSINMLLPPQFLQCNHVYVISHL